jgi:homoserine dehydrogenase
MTCKTSGKNGVVTGYYLRKGFEDCVDRAKAAGYAEGQPTRAGGT